MFSDESFRNCFVKVEPFTSSRAYTTIISDPGIYCTKSILNSQGQFKSFQKFLIFWTNFLK